MVVADRAEVLAVAAEVGQAQLCLEERHRGLHVGHRQAHLADLDQQLVARRALARDQLDQVARRVEVVRGPGAPSLERHVLLDQLRLPASPVDGVTEVPRRSPRSASRHRLGTKRTRLAPYASGWNAAGTLGSAAGRRPPKLTGRAAPAGARPPARTGRRAPRSARARPRPRRRASPGRSSSSHGDRRRHRRPLARAQRVDAHGRLLLVVLAPVDQHLAARSSFRCCDTISPGAHPPGDAPARATCLRAVVVVHLLVVQRHVHLDAPWSPTSSRSSRGRSGERLAEQEPPRSTRPGGAGARIEVEGHHRRPVDLGHLRQRGMQLEIGQVGEPDERRQVVADAKVDPLSSDRAHPSGGSTGTASRRSTRPRPRSGSA